MQMQVVFEPSKICKDIYELEKDFRYNLSLLKQKDAEIERFKLQNKVLSNDVQRKEQEIIYLHSIIHKIENVISQANVEKSNIESNSKETISKLWNDLTELKKIHENCKHVQAIQIQKREAEINRTYTNIARMKEMEFQKKIVELDDNLKRKVYSEQKLNMKIQKLIDENISLRTQYQDKQSYYTSKLYTLELELQTMNLQKTKLQAELKELKRKSTLFDTKLTNVLSAIDILKQILSECNRENDNAKSNLNELYQENEKLNIELDKNKDELQACLVNLKGVECDREQLEIKFKCLERKPLESKCTNSEHQNIDNILKQNSILQEVIKTMRKERNENDDTQEMEKKVQRLEDLVIHLKTSMMTAIQIKNNAVH